MRHLFRNHGRGSVRLSRRRRHLDADSPTPSAHHIRGGADAIMIRLILPAQLRALARVGSVEVELRIEGQPTQRSVLDALEAEYPALRGLLRDHVSPRRPPLLPFFACQEVLSREPRDAPLPQAVASGAELLIVVAAIAGG